MKQNQLDFMAEMNYNPDILECIANLSNDEVFTPPAVANKMLDMLPDDLWSNPDAKFLDPCCKSGVFLREIAKRLIAGLETKIPDLQERVNHIFTKQLFAISITDLTAQISRRTTYCSRNANSDYSICSEFADEQGNIKYRPIEHNFDKTGRCRHCGASESVFGKEKRGKRESHAYEFIHTDNPQELFKDMKFDVIIGNPPYQMEDGGGRDSSAVPLYHKFILQAKKLNPHYLSMIVPARWYTGGKGLDEFRNEMLNDTHLSIIHDFPETNDCFPGLNIRGGVCYFLWDNESNDDCEIYNHIGEKVSKIKRPLLEKGSDMLIRYNDAISIYRKVLNFGEQKFSEFVSERNPFSIPSNFNLFSVSKTQENDIKLYRFGNEGYISSNQVVKNKDLINKWKVIVSKASPGGDEYPHSIVSQPIIAEPNSVCSETYLVIKEVTDKNEAENLISYIKTRFFRFMMSLIKNTQNISRRSYSFVPLQDFSKPWTDEELYAKYGLSEEEKAFIEGMIRPME